MAGVMQARATGCTRDTRLHTCAACISHRFPALVPLWTCYALNKRGPTSNSVAGLALANSRHRRDIHGGAIQPPPRRKAVLAFDAHVL